MSGSGDMNNSHVSFTMDDMVNVLYSSGGRRGLDDDHSHHGSDCPYQSGMYTSNHSSEEENSDVEDSIAMYQRYVTQLNAKPKVIDMKKRPTAEEANKLARQLIQEEELEKEKEERKKAKKKKKKERQKQKQRDKKIHDGDGDEEERPELPPSETKKPAEKEAKKPVERDEREAKLSNSSHAQANNKQLTAQTNEHHSSAEDRISSNSSDDEESIDTSSAFFARAASKKPAAAPPAAVPPRSTASQAKSKTNLAEDTSNESTTIPLGNSKKDPPAAANVSAGDTLTPLVQKSRRLAIQANKMAAESKYHEAIDLFQEAIQLDSTDFRFFGNRSFCYERIGEFKCALQDADAAISLAPQWPKGYFRKGRSLVGLKEYKAAEAAFEIVIKLEGHSQDAIFELTRVRTLMLVEMGFDAELASAAVSEHDTFQSALEALLEGRVEPEDDVYWSNGEGAEEWHSDEEGSADSAEFTVAGARSNTAQSKQNNANTRTQKSTSQAAQLQTANLTAEQRLPMKSCAVWVGNINSQVVTKEALERLFGRCGRVSYVKILPQKSCAFVNFDRLTDAEAAIEKLQGIELGGNNLCMRFSNNPQPGFISTANVASSKSNAFHPRR